MRLIDADKLKAHFAWWNDEYKDIFDSIIDQQRTVDTVRHGWWVTMSDAFGSYYACSECGESLERRQYYNPQFDLFPRLKSIDKSLYCPNCGAKMEEGGDAE